jgi:hypothetical protein
LKCANPPLLQLPEPMPGFDPFKEPWHIVLSALCSPSNLFRDLGFRGGFIFCSVLRHGFPLGSPPLSSSIA